MMITWTGLAPWEFQFPFPGSLTSTFPVQAISRTRHSDRLPPQARSRPRSPLRAKALAPQALAPPARPSAERESECVCERERVRVRERVCERDTVCVCVCERERERVRVRGRECERDTVCVCVYIYVCVCVCVPRRPCRRRCHPLPGHATPPLDPRTRSDHPVFRV